MKKTVLGISAFYHDSAAALVRDGEIVAAAQEERFSRKKYDRSFPFQAINYCMEEAFIDPTDLDAVVYYDNPVLTFDRVVKNFLMVAPAGAEQWIKAAKSILGVKARVRQSVERALGNQTPLLFADHHRAHAASAFYPSPFPEAAILTVDGVGEWATTTIGRGQENTIQLLKEIRYPHSLGLLYSAFTYFCGFRVNSGEHKLMGLAPYGRPTFAEVIKTHLIDIKEDGSFRLNMKYFAFMETDRMTSEAFHELFGGKPREPEAKITQRETDLAASVQFVLEEIMLKLARHAKSLTGFRDLVMAGGVALNCLANTKILREGIFEHLWIQPAAGDAGGALGAALLATYSHFGCPRKCQERDSQKGSLLGPRYGSQEIIAFLERRDYPYRRITDEAERSRCIAAELADGKIVGYFAGRMEFGPRALGARSILADPRLSEMQSLLNRRIKFRESFRPFAPAVLAERSAEYFDPNVTSPYMLLVAGIRKDKRQFPEPLDSRDDLMALAAQRRSDIPAVTHVDYSARVQTVDSCDNPDFHQILNDFAQLTGVPVLVNTSFNVRGEPIVCSPHDAYKCFMKTGIDLLVLEDCLLWKDRQPPWHENKADEYEPD